MSVALVLDSTEGAALVIDALLCLAEHQPDRARDATAFANSIGDQLDRLPRPSGGRDA